MKRFLFLLLLAPLFSSCQPQMVCCRPIVLLSNLPPITNGLVTDFDFSNTSTVTQSAGTVASITDQAGSVVSSQSTSANRPTYSTSGGSNNKAYATFSGTQWLSGALLSNSVNHTMLIVRRLSPSAIPDYYYGGVGLFQNGQGSTGYGIVDVQGNATRQNTGAYYPGVDAMSAPYYLNSTSRWEIVATSFTSGNPRTYNTLGAYFAPGRDDMTPNVPATGHWIGKIDGGPYPFIGDIEEILLYNRQLSDAEIITVNQYLQAKYALPLPPFLCFEGDSITAGTDGGGGIPNYPFDAYLGQLPSTYFYLRNSARPGANSLEMVDSLAYKVLPYYQSQVRNVFAMMIFHNDVGSEIPLDSTIAHITNCFTRTHAVGYKNILITPLNTTGYSQSLTNAVVAYELANYRSMGADTIFNANVVTNLTDPTNTTYYYDGVHLTVTGVGVLGAAMQSIIAYEVSN